MSKSIMKIMGFMVFFFFTSSVFTIQGQGDEEISLQPS